MIVPPSSGASTTRVEVWGVEPQTYGLQSHRSSQLSYTPRLIVPY